MIYRVLWGLHSWGIEKLHNEMIEIKLESELMEEEVMCWKVWLSLLELLLYLPLVKGTSTKKEGVSKLVREIEVVLRNAFFPVEKMDNSGRSNNKSTLFKPVNLNDLISVNEVSPTVRLNNLGRSSKWNHMI